MRILSTIDRELLKPSASVALHKHSNALVDVLPPEADSSISMLSAGRSSIYWMMLLMNQFIIYCKYSSCLLWNQFNLFQCNCNCRREAKHQLCRHRRHGHSEARGQRGCWTTTHTLRALQTDWHWSTQGRAHVWTPWVWKNHVGKSSGSPHNWFVWKFVNQI